LSTARRPVSATNEAANEIVLGLAAIAGHLRPTELGHPFGAIGFPGGFTDADHAGQLQLGFDGKCVWLAHLTLHGYLCHTTDMSKRGYTAEAFGARTVHLLDVENLLGGTRFTVDEVRSLLGRVCEVARVEAGDSLIVASSHHCAPAAWFGCPQGARRLVRSGPDGADIALGDVISQEGIATRYTRVVIGSGDGFFAEAAAKLQAAGCHVTVLTRRAGLSRRLRLACPDVRFIDDPANEPEVATVTSVTAREAA
jgi:hypothetical protein